ncbi:MAG: TetR/AcrR family transcriptional regulator [Verrucomicrobia bacterium]|nr:TetR/AcrR family transcriptional regulator [Verrucomicrobiota bacterium]
MKKQKISLENQLHKASKNLTKSDLISLFVKEWSEEGVLPKSVFSFCKVAKISEENFYSLFPSLQAIEKAFWKQWIDEVIQAISQTEAWGSFSAKERYLSFLFAITSASLKYRSLLLERLSEVSVFSNPSFLESLHQSFLHFIEEVINQGKETKEIASRGNLMKLYPPILYLHFRFFLSYFLNDESEEYQKSDAFIEKTVTLAFDLFRSQAPESASDLIKFLISSSGCYSNGAKQHSSE